MQQGVEKELPVHKGLGGSQVVVVGGDGRIECRGACGGRSS